MITVNAYLTFPGNCREAFDFYRSVFRGEFSFVGTFADMPPQEGMPPISEDMKENIMHMSLPISKETVLMGSDADGEWTPDLKVGNNISLSVNTSNKAEATRIFNSLAEGGKVTMALADTFWESYFGMLTDKFGINWMVDCALEGHK